MSIKRILSEELERISLLPKEERAFSNTAKEIISSLKEVGVKAYIGGSLAKGTMVKKEGVQDVDVFVVFDYSEDILNLEKNWPNSLCSKPETYVFW